MGNEVPPGVSGTREQGKKHCWEEGNKRKIKLGTREQKLCRTFKRKGKTKIEKKKLFRVLGNRGKQGKFCWEKGNIDHPWETLGNGASGPYFKRRMQRT